MIKNKDNKEEKILELESKITEITHNWRRALADYQNLERRTKDEKEQFAKYAKEEFVKKMLPFFDSLEKTSLHIKDEGLMLSLKNLQAILNSEGITIINCQGQNFDPKIMEAIDAINGEENKVIEVVRPGYLLFDKLIRPAQVRVGKGK